MAHPDGRPEIDNLFARRVTPRVQLLGWDMPRDPNVIRYEIWAAEGLNEERPAVEDLHLQVDAFPNLGDGRHYLFVKHDLSAPWDCIVFLRAVNREHHGDPPTHTHLAADYEVSIDARQNFGSHDDPPLIVTFDVTHGTKRDEIELSRDTVPVLIGMTFPHHGSIEEFAFQFHAPHYSLTRLEGGKAPIERRIVDRTHKRASGGKFRRDRALPNGIPAHVLNQREIIPQVRLCRGSGGQLSAIPHVRFEISEDSHPLPAVGAEILDVWPGPDGERVEMRAVVVALGTDRNGMPVADVVIEGRAASLMHARLLAAFRGETGALV